MIRLCRLAAALVLAAASAPAYSVLTHEAVVDASWKTELVPALRARFPGITDQSLLEAHAYAYGGCIIQDMGYYPLGNKFFTDLVHYVRSGDFVEALLRDARDPNEYAFALGALAHYTSDNNGHPAVNRAVALEYPKKRAKYGNVIRYASYPAGHIAVEFSFDVAQVVRGRYASKAYHDFIGFEVAQDLLERAFQETYGIKLADLFLSMDLTIGTFRWAVGGLIPHMTQVAVASHAKDFDKQFLYRYNRRLFEKEYGRKYRRPGWFARLLAAIFHILPKFGPLKPLAFKAPDAQIEKLFLESFNATLKRYQEHVAEVRAGTLDLRDTNLDDGKPTAPGEYTLSDETFSKLTRKVADEPPGEIPTDLRRTILSFYSNPDAPNAERKHHKDWRKTLAAVNKLRQQKAQPTAVESEDK